MKKYLLASIAFFLAVGMSAFTSKRSTEQTTEHVWFLFNGGDETEPSNYSLYGESGEFPPACEEETGVLCAIKAPMINGQPDIPNKSQERLKVSN